MPPKIQVQLYFDVVSPWSYIAFETLERYKAAWNIELELCPAFLGGIMIASGNQPPATNPHKGAYMLRDLARVADEYQLVVKTPPNFPENTLPAIRLLRVLKDRIDAKQLEQCVRAIFVQIFTHNKPIASTDFFQCLSSIISAEKLAVALQESQKPENKDRCKAEPVALVEERGVFGFPWIVVKRSDEETQDFFGSDRMASIAHWLGQGYSFDGPYPQGFSPRL